VKLITIFLAVDAVWIWR